MTHHELNPTPGLDGLGYVPSWKRLVRRVTTYTGELLSEAGYTDDQRAEAEVAA